MEHRNGHAPAEADSDHGNESGNVLPNPAEPLASAFRSQVQPVLERPETADYEQAPAQTKPSDRIADVFRDYVQATSGPGPVDEKALLRRLHPDERQEAWQMFRVHDVLAARAKTDPPFSLHDRRATEGGRDR